MLEVDMAIVANKGALLLCGPCTESATLLQMARLRESRI